VNWNQLKVYFCIGLKYFSNTKRSWAKSIDTD